MASDDLTFARIASQFFGVPLLLRPPEAEVIGGYLRSRMIGAGPDANRFQGQEEFDAATRRWKGYRKEGSVGVVSIMGELVNRGAWLGASSGLTSYEGIAQQIRNAASDKDVKSIILDIQSPGGQAIGMNETARLIRSIAAEKKVVAVVNAMAASAAYGLASGASEIVVTESGIAGSIGVLLVHHDRSRQFDKAGITTTIVKAGDEKAIGSPYIALSEDDRAVLQAEVDRVMAGFVRIVSDHRPKLTTKAIRELQAGIRIGEDAVKAGLADRLGSFENTIGDLSRSASRSSAVSISVSQLAVTAADRHRIINADHRLAGSAGLRSLAMQAAGREPHKTAEQIVRETVAVFGSSSAPPPSRDDRGAALRAALGARDQREGGDPLAGSDQPGAGTAAAKAGFERALDAAIAAKKDAIP